jgi:hypothetical protein
MKLAKDVSLILLLAAVWFGTAYYAGEALIPTWGVQCGLVSLITGLIGLVIVNRSKEGRRLFYEGSNEDDQLGCLKLLVISLIGLPFILFLLGTIWWLMRLLGFFEFQ